MTLLKECNPMTDGFRLKNPNNWKTEISSKKSAMIFLGVKYDMMGLVN